jgi:hypothetical protein
MQHKILFTTIKYKFRAQWATISYLYGNETVLVEIHDDGPLGPKHVLNCNK